LIEDELVAMQSMLFNDAAEIVHTACKPLRVAKLDTFIVSRDEGPLLTEREDCRLARPFEHLPWRKQTLKQQ